MGKTKLDRRRNLMMGAPRLQGPARMAHLILDASRTSGARHYPKAWLPSVAARVSDQQIADMAACVRNAWGNQVRRNASVDTY